MAREQSSIGSSIYYGARSTDKVGASIASSPGEDYLVYDFDFASLPGADADDAVTPVIPAGAVITEAILEVTTGFAGNSFSQFDIGLIQTGGGTIDVDGLFADVVSTATGISVGSGALIGISIGSNAGQLLVTGLTVVPGASAPTSGAGQIRIKYYLPAS